MAPHNAVAGSVAAMAVPGGLRGADRIHDRISRKALFYCTSARPMDSRSPARQGCRQARLTIAKYLFWAVAMHYFNPIPRCPEILAYILGNHYRAVLAAGAAERDRQITLAFADIVGQQVHQQL